MHRSFFFLYLYTFTFHIRANQRHAFMSQLYLEISDRRLMARNYSVAMQIAASYNHMVWCPVCSNHRKSIQRLSTLEICILGRTYTRILTTDSNREIFSLFSRLQFSFNAIIATIEMLFPHASLFLVAVSIPERFVLRVSREKNRRKRTRREEHDGIKRTVSSWK